MENFEKLFKKYGKTQLVVAMEELAELQQAISKFYRNFDKPLTPKLRHDLIYEMADVILMLDQLQYILYKKTGEHPEKIFKDIERIYHKKYANLEKYL